MTSSSRISLILLVFFLLPTVVFPLECYITHKDDSLGFPTQSDCPTDNEKCIKSIARQSIQGIPDSVYGCVDETEPNGWSVYQDQGGDYDELVCDTDKCNSPLAFPPPPTTAAPPTTTTLGYVDPPSSSSQGTGVSWMYLCLTGLMTSWLLVIT